MKILGVTLNARTSMDLHLSRMKAKVGHELSKIKPYLSSMNNADQKIIVNAKLKSILDYGLPLFMGKNSQVRSKLEAAYMLVNRITHGGYTFKVNKNSICETIKSDLPNQAICKTAVTFLHKHLLH